MVQFNFSERTIKAKVVYYGPAQSGKTTNLEQIHRITDPAGTNRLISLNTAQDRTLFFDLLPFSLGAVSGYDFKVQLYTVPGQVQYNATRRVVLAGADAVVFVADSRRSMFRENLSAFENMKVNLLANRLVPEKVPLVLQFNKQDLSDLQSEPELRRALNPWGRPCFRSVASRGDGVLQTFVAVVQEMLTAIALKYNLKEKGLDPAAVSAVVAEAFSSLLKETTETAPPPPAPGEPPRPPARVVISQPMGPESAAPLQSAPETGLVSEELLHRAIRSNVELAEALANLVRDMNLGLGTILSHAELLMLYREEAKEKRANAIASIQQEATRLRRVMQELGMAGAAASSGKRAAARSGPAPALSTIPAPARQTPVPSSSLMGAPAFAQPAVAAPMVARPAAGFTAPAPSPPTPPEARVLSATLPAAAAPSPSMPAARPLAPPRPPLAAGDPARPVPPSLDALVREAVAAARGALEARGIRIGIKVPPSTPPPRVPPPGLRRALAALFQGLGGAAPPASAIEVRCERRPVLLRSRDGAEVRRDFLMLALLHPGVIDAERQQRILQGAYPGPVTDGCRLVREMGGFVRFTPAGPDAMETRLFLPAP